MIDERYISTICSAILLSLISCDDITAGSKSSKNTRSNFLATREIIQLNINQIGDEVNDFSEAGQTVLIPYLKKSIEDPVAQKIANRQKIAPLSRGKEPPHKNFSIKSSISNRPFSRALISQKSTEKFNSELSDSAIAKTDQPDKINRSLAKMGIGVTSLLFVILLWVLFKPDSKAALVNTPSQEADHDLNLFDANQMLINQEKLVSPQLTASMEIDTKVGFAKDVERLSERDKQASLLADNSYSFKLDSVKKSGTTEEHVQIDADKTGRVRIVTSQTTEIDVVYELIQDLRQTDLHLRRKAIWELTQISDSRSIEPLVEIMPQVNSLDKSLILNAITQIAHRNFASINDVLFASLEDKNSEVRKNAIRDLTVLHNPASRVTKRLAQMLQDSDQEVCKTAEWALTKINLGSFPAPHNNSLNQGDAGHISSSRSNPG